METTNRSRTTELQRLQIMKPSDIDSETIILTILRDIKDKLKLQQRLETIKEHLIIIVTLKNIIMRKV